jgi:hypothetical protein
LRVRFGKLPFGRNRDPVSAHRDQAYLRNAVTHRFEPSLETPTGWGGRLRTSHGGIKNPPISPKLSMQILKKPRNWTDR